MTADRPRQDRTAAARKAAQRNRNREMGLVEFSVVVPEADREAVLEMAATLREQHIRRLILEEDA